MWSDLEKEAIGSWWLRLLSYLFIRIKHLSGRVPRSHKPYFLPALRWLSSKVGQQLSRASLVACETAVEVALALAWSPAAQWLREVEQAAPLQVRHHALHSLRQLSCYTLFC